MELSAITALLAAGAFAPKVIEGLQDAQAQDELRALSAVNPNQIQFLAGNVVAGKSFTYSNGRYLTNEQRFPKEARPWRATANNLREFVAELQKAERDPRKPVMILGCPIVDGERSIPVRELFAKTGGMIHRRKKDDPTKDGVACVDEVPRHGFCIDFDSTPAQIKWCAEQKLDVYADPTGAVKACADRFLPQEFSSCTYAYQLSSSCGLSGGSSRTIEPHRAKFHLFYWLRKPALPEVVKVWLIDQRVRNIEHGFGAEGDTAKVGGGIDHSLYHAVQPHYLSARFTNCEDPLAGKRWGFVKGASEVLDLVLTDGRHGELFAIPDKKSSAHKTATVQVGTGAAARRISWERITSKDGGMEWPKGYRNRLAEMPTRGTNATTFFAGQSLGWHLVSTYGDDAEKSDEYKRAVQEFFDAIDATPREDNSQARIALHRNDALDHIREGIEAARALISEKRARKRRVPPHFANKERPLSEVEAAMDERIRGFFEDAGKRMDYALALDEGKIPLLSNEWVGVPRLVVNVTPGAGKTYAALRGFISSGLAGTSRIYFFAPTHKKAGELKKDFEKVAAEMGVSLNVSVFEGIERACAAKKTDKVRYEAAKKCAAAGIPVKASACADCPLANKCAWIKQADDRSPGVKILPTAYLGAGIPGLAGGDKDDAPVLALVIDEDFRPNLKMERTVGFDAIPKFDDFRLTWPPNEKGEELELLPDDEQKWLLYYAACAVRGLCAKEGPISFSHFDRLMASRGAGHVSVARVCELLTNYTWDVKKLVAAEVRKALEAGNQPDFETEAVLRRVSLLDEFMQMLRTVRFARPNDDTTAACKVEHTKAGDKLMHLFWYRRLDEKLHLIPLLHLDATTEPERCKLSFQAWDEVLLDGTLDHLVWDDVDLNVEFVSFDVAAPHMKLAKVVNAPMGKRSFDKSGTKLIETQRKGRRKQTVTTVEESTDEVGVDLATGADNDNGKTVRERVPKALHGNAAWLPLLRAADAIVSRAVADGREAGAISYQNVEKYAETHGYIKGANVGHFGNLRGMNAWEESRVVVTLGRTVPVDAKLEDETEAQFVLDRHGRRPTRGLGIKRVLRGIRVVGDDSGEPDGVGIEVEEPACPLVAMIYRAQVAAELAQAIGRARGVRRTAADPVEVFDFSPVLLNATYSAVIDWSAFADITEVHSVLHSQGVIPFKPGDFKAMAPQLFADGRQSKVQETQQTEQPHGNALWLRTKRMFDRAGVARWDKPPRKQSDSLYKEYPLYIEDMTGFGGVCPTWPKFTEDSVLYGDPCALEALKPAIAEPETYRKKSDRAHLPCIVDSARRPAAAASLRRAIGCGLGKAPTGRPRKETANAETLRKRAQRAKRAEMAKATKRQQRARKG